MNMTAFFDRARKSFGPLSQSQVDGFNAVIEASGSYKLLTSQLAYFLATAWHETAATMQPIREYGKGKGHEYGKPTSYGNQVAYGRGYVQLTWQANYERADRELGLGGALLRNFDLALEPSIAAKIMFRGMMQGWFTSRKVGDFINPNLKDFVNARRVVNGTDKAETIAGYARDFEKALFAAIEAPPSPVEPPAPTPVTLPKQQEPVGKPSIQVVMAVIGAILVAIVGFLGLR